MHFIVTILINTNSVSLISDVQGFTFFLNVDH